MTVKNGLPTVYIGDKFTLDGTEVVVGDAVGIENLGGGLVGVVVTVLSDDVHIDPSAMSHRTRIVAGDDLYPAGRVDETVAYLKATREHVYARHVDMYGVMADHMPNEVIDVIDEVLDGLGVPVVDDDEEAEEVRPWGSSEVIRTTPGGMCRGVDYAEEVVLHRDGLSFVTDGDEVEWVDAKYVANLCIDVTTRVVRLWPVDDPDHVRTPLVEEGMITSTEVTWDAVYGGGAYTLAGRSVRVRFTPSVDCVSDVEYEVRVNHRTEYNDVDSLLTRDEFTEEGEDDDE